MPHSSPDRERISAALNGVNARQFSDFPAQSVWLIDATWWQIVERPERWQVNAFAEMEELYTARRGELRVPPINHAQTWRYGDHGVT